jgi:5-methylcytosine-specific restriction endonuclease McrA
MCVPGYAEKVRNVPDAVKKQVYEEYGITSHKPGEYEVDHLISLELGGSNSIKNLWPQSYSGNWNAHIKDKLENGLHKLVCSDKLDLKTAQREIAMDWIAAYYKYLGQPAQ